MSERITVTGSTGTIGREVVRLLTESRSTVRAIYRDAAKAALLRAAETVRADLSDPDALRTALKGTTRLFLLTDNAPGFARTQIAVVEAAIELGVHHIVKTSALGASDHSRSWIAREHWEVEQAIQRSSVGWTMLRPHGFMQNWLGDVAASVRTEGVILSPIGDGRVPFIDTRDIAAVAALVLQHPEGHEGKKYVLTGGTAVGMADLAATLTEVTGRPVTYRPITMDTARSRLAAQGIPEQVIEATLAIAAYQRDGGPTATVSPTVERLLGRPPRTIRNFARDYRAAFVSSPVAHGSA